MLSTARIKGHRRLVRPPLNQVWAIASGSRPSEAGVNDARCLELAQVCRPPAGDGLDALEGPLVHLHHDPRLAAQLPVLPTQRLVQHQARSHFGRCAGSSSSPTTFSRGMAISMENVYLMGGTKP
ncbi:hypothetical protein AB0H36_12030 [Kribbella sp. NPDC050820]|uniref:hypothetical protein n=1 Tax=Kribbella sp. NPDC050820 TaxID=3155408 RepID=UPI00340A0369